MPFSFFFTSIHTYTYEMRKEPEVLGTIGCV